MLKGANFPMQLQVADRSELCAWANVVIFSTKGARSPLSLLGGGGYDGSLLSSFGPCSCEFAHEHPFRWQRTLPGRPSRRLH